MNPQPLIGVLADDRFQLRMHALGIRGDIASHVDFGIETNNIARFLGFPEGKAGNHGGSGVVGELDESGSGAGLAAEEIDEDAFG